MRAAKPHHLSLCILLRSYLSKDESDSANELQLLSYSDEERHRLGQFLLSEIKMTNSIMQPKLSQLFARLQAFFPSNCMGDKLIAIIVNQLQAVDDVDDLMQLFQDVAGLVGEGNTNVVSEGETASVADPQSVLGLFLRKCCVAFTALSFEGVCHLLDELRDYFREGLRTIDTTIFIPEVKSKAVAQDDDLLDAFLNTRLHSSEAETGRSPRTVLDSPLAELSTMASGVAKAHLAQCFTAVQHRDVTAAVESLHQYFDVCSVKTREAQGAAAAAEGDRKPADSTRFHSALLSLTSLHTKFGHVDEAMQALNETVRVAQQHSDDSCLAHALAALCHIMLAMTPAAAETATSTTVHQSSAPSLQLLRLLGRCLKRGQELQLPHIVTFCQLALAKIRCHQHIDWGADGGGTAPSNQWHGSGVQSSGAIQVDDAIRHSQHMHHMSQLSSFIPGTLSQVQGPTGSSSVGRAFKGGIGDLYTNSQQVFGANLAGSEASSAAAVEQLLGEGYLLRSSCWRKCGGALSSQVSSLIALSSYQAASKAEDRCLAYAQLAMAAAERRGSRAAEQILAMADQEYPFSNDPHLTAARLTIAHQRALHRRDFSTASVIGSQLFALAPTDESSNQELRILAEERAVRLQLELGNYSEAASAALELFGRCVAAGEQISAVVLLLLLARAHLETESAVNGLPYVLSALMHAQQMDADVITAEATVLLAEVWLQIHPLSSSHARSLVASALPLIIAHAPLAVQCTAHMALVHSITANATPQDVIQEADSVCEALAAAAQGYETLEDWKRAAESHHQLALVYDFVGDIKRRNEAAAAFCRLMATEEHMG